MILQYPGKTCPSMHRDMHYKGRTILTPYIVELNPFRGYVREDNSFTYTHVLLSLCSVHNHIQFFKHQNCYVKL